MHMPANAAPARQAQAAKRPKLSKDDLFRPFQTPLPRMRPSVGYRFAVACVALLVVLLPLIYLGLTAAVGYGLWIYATRVEPGFGIFSSGLMSGGGARGKVWAVVFAMIGYGAVYVVGGVLLLLMLKPLWPRRQEHDEQIGVSRAEQPLLYEFVDRLCHAVGAPAPDKIVLSCDVNAAAGVRKSLLGLGGEMTLLIGMPLAAGMTLRQLTGVLAHEFGHFAQGGATYLERLINSTLNAIAHAALGRDGLDHALHDFANDEETFWPLRIVAGLSLLAIWLVRRILFVMLYVGTRLGRHVTRQREYDADRYEARVASSAEFARTSDRLLQLNVAAAKAYSALRGSFLDRKLPEDVPALIAAEATLVGPSVLQQAREAERNAKRHWSDTHPPTHLRVAAAKKGDEPGIFDVKAPASVLFRDFRRLCKEVTLRHYKVEHGIPLNEVTLVPTTAVVQAETKQHAHADALRRYAQGLVTPARPIFPDRTLPAPDDRDHALSLLKELRRELATNGDSLRSAARSWDAAEDGLLRADAARSLLSAGVGKLKVGDALAAKLGRSSVKSAAQLAGPTQAWADERGRSRTTVRAALSDLVLRLHLARSLAPEKTPATPTSKKQPGEFDDAFVPYDVADAGPDAVALAAQKSAAERQADALETLESAWPCVAPLRESATRIGAMLAHLDPQVPAQPLIDAIVAESKRCASRLAKLRAALGDAPNPYPTKRPSDATLAGAVAAEKPDGRNPPATHAATVTTLDRLESLYMRLAADWCARAEAAEKRLGLPPLPTPREEADAGR